MYTIAAMGLVAFSLFLRRASLRAGFFLDDYNQQSLIAGNMWPRRGMWEMHVAARGDEAAALISSGVLPWWTEPTLVFAPLRPLTSLFIWFGYCLSNHDPVVLHAVSLALFAVFTGLVLRLFYRMLPVRSAYLGAIFFALAPVHCGATAWIASQALLVAAVFGALSLNAYVDFRRSRSRVALAVYALAYALALLGGEYGLSFAGYFAAYELFLARDGFKTRALALLPAVVVSGVYLSWHFLGGYGTRGVSLYVNVFLAPLHLFNTLSRSVPSHVVHGLTGYPMETAEGGFAGWAVAVVLIFWILLRWTRTGARGTQDPRGKGQALFWLAGGVLATLPYGAVHYSSRLGVLPHIGFAAALSVLVEAIVLRLRAEGALRDAGSWFAGACALGVVVMGGVFAPYESQKQTELIALRQHMFADRAARAPVLAIEEKTPPRYVFLLSALNVPIAQTMGLTRVAQGYPYALWRVLSPALGIHHFVRTSERSFRLRTMTLGIFTNPSASAYRLPESPLPRGSTIVTDELTIRVVASGSAGPYVLEFLFSEPLESPRYRFLLSMPGGFEIFRPPKVFGEATVPPALLSPLLPSSTE